MIGSFANVFDFLDLSPIHFLLFSSQAFAATIIHLTKIMFKEEETWNKRNRNEQTRANRVDVNKDEIVYD